MDRLEHDVLAPAPKDFRLFLVIMAAVIVPSMLTLMTVVHPGNHEMTSSNPTPYGYTYSLLLFLVPAALLAIWFLRHPDYHIERKAFWRTTAQFSAAGLVLDIGFGNTFFTFDNPGATLRIDLPGFVIADASWIRNVPLEDVSFYLFGCLFMLLLYIWGDLFWLGSHDATKYEEKAKKLPKVVHAHWGFIWLGTALAVAGILYKWYGPHATQEGFPGYFVLLIFAFVVVIGAFFNGTKQLINWRAMSMSMIAMWLISVIWEATLAVPYGWWGYKPDQMLGIYVGGWHHLPIEEPLLWTCSTWCIVTLYEVFRVHYNKKTPLMETMFGERF